MASAAAPARPRLWRLVQFLPRQVRSCGRRPEEVRQDTQVLLGSPDRGRDALLEDGHLSR